MTVSNGNTLSVRDAGSRSFDDGGFRGAQSLRGRTRDYQAHMPVDAYTTDDEVVVIASVPGVRPEDVHITFEGDTLTLQGQTPQPDQGRRYLVNELFYGKWSRTLRVNVPIDVTRVEATFEDGVLTVVLPKAEEVKPRVIQVKAKK
jgi:HSP20 family protein